MFQRRGKEAGYPQQRTLGWLCWLARRMIRHNQTIFRMEWMQPDWLPSERQRRYTTRVRLLNRLVVAPVVGLGFGLGFGLLGGLVVGLVIGLLGGLVIGLVNGLLFGLVWGLLFGLLFGLVWGLESALNYGGSAALNHYTFRWMLYRNGCLPLRPVPFLDYCAERIFLRKVGGGYIFVHRLLMEHFASQDTEALEETAKRV
jgi:hypothetical protein